MKFKLPLYLGACGLVLAGGLLLHAQSENPPAPPADQPARASRDDRGTPGGRGEFLRERIAERLGLTAEQKTKLDAVRATQRQKIGALLQDNSLSDEQRRAKIRDAAKEGREQMKAVLTPEQQEKVKAFMHRLQQRRGPGGPGFAQWGGPQGGRPPIMGAMMLRERGFGPQGGRPSFGPGGPGAKHAPGLGSVALAEKLNLSAEQRKQLADLRFQAEEKELALRKEIKALHEQMKSVLTPEQQQKLKEHRGPGAFGGPGAGGPGRGPRFGQQDEGPGDEGFMGPDATEMPGAFAIDDEAAGDDDAL